MSEFFSFVLLIAISYQLAKRHAKCIIEEVESKEQIKIIEKLGISYVQGYYFSAAIPDLMIQKYNPKEL